MFLEHYLDLFHIKGCTPWYVKFAMFVIIACVMSGLNMYQKYKRNSTTSNTPARRLTYVICSWYCPMRLVRRGFVISSKWIIKHIAAMIKIVIPSYCVLKYC